MRGSMNLVFIGVTNNFGCKDTKNNWNKQRNSQKSACNYQDKGINLFSYSVIHLWQEGFGLRKLVSAQNCT